MTGEGCTAVLEVMDDEIRCANFGYLYLRKRLRTCGPAMPPKLHANTINLSPKMLLFITLYLYEKIL